MLAIMLSFLGVWLAGRRRLVLAVLVFVLAGHQADQYHGTTGCCSLRSQPIAARRSGHTVWDSCSD